MEQINKVVLELVVNDKTYALGVKRGDAKDEKFEYSIRWLFRAAEQTLLEHHGFVVSPKT